MPTGVIERLAPEEIQAMKSACSAVTDIMSKMTGDPEKDAQHRMSLQIAMMTYALQVSPARVIRLIAQVEGVV